MYKRQEYAFGFLVETGLDLVVLAHELFEAGAEDCSVAKDGDDRSVRIDFDREDIDYEAAVGKALDQMKQADPEIVVRESW